MFYNATSNTDLFKVNLTLAHTLHYSNRKMKKNESANVQMADEPDVASALELGLALKLR